MTLAFGADAPAQTIDFGAYHALLIANQDYEYWPDLKTPGADVAVLEGILRDGYGFQVHTLRDATRTQIIDTIERLKRELTDDDNLLIYYAGHGKLRSDGGYWIGVDAPTDSRSLWVHSQEISALLDPRNGMLARHVMVIADSCYSGVLVRAEGGIDERPPNQSQAAWWARMQRDLARTALTSGGTEPVVDAVGDSRHSIFADELIGALARNQGVLEGSALHDAIKADVHARAQRFAGNDAQAPDYGRIAGAGHQGGDFLFVRPGQVVRLEEAAPAETGGVRGLPGEGVEDEVAPAAGTPASSVASWAGQFTLETARSRVCGGIFTTMDVELTVSGNRIEGTAEGTGMTRVTLPIKGSLGEGGKWTAEASGSPNAIDVDWVVLHITGDLPAGTASWRDTYNGCRGSMALSRVD